MRIFLTGFLCFVCTLVYADGLDKVLVRVENFYTNASANQGESTRIAGYIERVDTWYANSTSICHAVLISSNAFTGKSTTLYQSLKTATGISVYPRVSGYDTAGNASGGTNGLNRYVALDEKLYLIVTNAVYSNQTMTAVVIYEAK